MSLLRLSVVSSVIAIEVLFVNVHSYSFVSLRYRFVICDEAWGIRSCPPQLAY